MKNKTYFGLILFIIFSLLFIASFTIQAEEEIHLLETYQYVDYTVRAGDSLYRIAQEHGSTVDSIMALNGLESYTIHPGQTLRIAVPREDNQEIYTVVAGDSLYRISRQFNVSIDSIKKANALSSDTIFVGQRLVIPVDAENEEEIEDGNNFEYTVVAGDSLYRISQRYNVSIESIRKANNLSSDMIFVGQTLIIPVSGENNYQEDSRDEREDDSENKEKESDISYESISGRVLINNKTRGSEVSRQDADLDYEILPVNENINRPLYQGSEIIVKYNPMISAQSVEDFEKENNLISISSLTTDEANIVKYKTPEGKEVEELIAYYNEKDNIAWAEPNYIYYPTAIPSDQYYNFYQWDMVNMNMEAAWDISKGDSSVVVAVIDTGIIPDHPDLRANLLQGANFVGGERRHPIRSYSPSNNDPTDTTTRAEGGSHGTHVSGIIGAVTDNNIGVAGVSWDVSILPIRALRNSGGSSWDIAEAIYYAIDQGANVINMSFGGNGRSTHQHEAIREAVSRGVTVVAATGNENSTVYYPAAFPETIAVGSVGRNNTRAGYSNYGPEVDVVAPGGNFGESIFSTWGYYDNGRTVSNYNGMIGTSMAAPHVSGVAALLYANGVRNPEEIRERLTSTARDLGSAGRNNEYGYGLVDAYGALLNRKIANPKVFTAIREGENLYINSEVRNARDNGSFNLNRAASNSEYLVAWIDANDNGVVDSGDYFAKVEYRGSSNNIQIDMPYLSRTNNNIYYNVIK
ncbi:S8 family peptidase [Natronospora cellulosivora (SeqCode)]